MADDPRHRLAGNPPPDKRDRPRFNIGCDRFVAAHRKRRRVNSHGVRNEEPRIESGRALATFSRERLGKRRREPAPQAFDREFGRDAQAPSAASRLA